ncbi:hypothetical protein evm_011787 [Chilo suppressalis]|nr:hypothetical protein evm_011787 [Chilo suppressalis]
MKATPIIIFLTLLVFVCSEFGGAYAKPQVDEPVELSRTLINQEVEEMLRNPLKFQQFVDKTADVMVSMGHMIEELKKKWSR